MKRNRLTVVLAVAAGILGLPGAAQAQAGYADTVLDDDPLTYLRLNEAPGAPVAQDASVHDRDGAYAGGVTLGGPGPFIDAGTAATLATSGSVTANVPAASGSVELWVNPNRMVKNPQLPIVSHGNPTAGGWALGIGDKRKLWWKSGGSTVKTTINIGSGVWTALTVTWDGTNVRFYRNGALAKTANSPAAQASGAGDLVVGGTRPGTFNNPFAGKIDEVALYSQVLALADISGHFGAARVPVNTTPPTIGDDGTPAVGETLTANPGTWNPAGTASYQWQRCDGAAEVCVNVNGATGSTYLLADGDECSTFQVVVTQSNTYGSASAVAGPTDVVATCAPDTDPAPINVTPPTITGTAAVGQTLTAQPGDWEPMGTATYRWQRYDGGAWVDIAGETATTYVVVAGDDCSTLRVVETMTNATGGDSAASDATAGVGPCDPGTDPAPVNTALPAITGTAAVGETLTAGPGTWDNGGAATYQWQRCDGAGANCAEIGGATATTYAVVSADACGTLRVAETMTASGSATAVSGQTAKVPGSCDTPPGTDPGTGGGGTGTGTGTGGGTGTGTGTGTDPGTQPAGCLKLLAGRKRLKLRRFGTLRLNAAAGACVTKPLGAVFKARKGMKLRSVSYKLDGKRLKRIKRPRYSARLTVSRLPAGTHTLTVRVRPRTGRAKTVKLRLRTAVA